MFDFLKKKDEPANTISVGDDVIVAPADGEQIDISTVSDPVFAEKMMGDGVAFKFPLSKVTVCAPANGTLSVLFPTGHAFGVTMNNGVEVLVHIGIETVNAKGDGFKLCGKKQGDVVRAGDPIVTADFEKLAKTYDVSTMLIITDPKDKTITFKAPGAVTKGQQIVE
ncbi:MAG: PTS glucose transporter subunit IIA [Solobacterium sp.]|nr:PTS glucose transporter subunit IIA [Solobacterium sp.]